MKINATSRQLLELRLNSLLSLSIRSYLNGSYGDAYNYREQAYAIFSTLKTFTTVELRNFNGYFYAALEENINAGTVSKFDLGDYAVKMCDIQEIVHRYNKGGATL